MKAKYLQYIMDLAQGKEEEQEDDEVAAEPTNDDDDKAHNKSTEDKKPDSSTQENKKNDNNKKKKKTKNKSTQTPNPDNDIPDGEDDALSRLPSMEDSADDEDTSSGGNGQNNASNDTVDKQGQSSPPPKKRSTMRYFVYALLLWLFEFGTVLVLKRLGIQLPELNEEVVQNVFDKQFGRLNESMPAALSYLTQETKRPGFQLAQEGATDHYPIVLLHGFVTSGLEVWAGQECAKKHFRQRFWASMYGTRSFLSDRDCWREHMSLNPYTGADPPGIRLRAAAGFEAVDYFMANYWVFAVRSTDRLILNASFISLRPLCVHPSHLSDFSLNPLVLLHTEND